jgi:hypothetical protein
MTIFHKHYNSSSSADGATNVIINTFLKKVVLCWTNSTGFDLCRLCSPRSERVRVAARASGDFQVLFRTSAGPAALIRRSGDASCLITADHRFFAVDVYARHVTDRLSKPFCPRSRADRGSRQSGIQTGYLVDEQFTFADIDLLTERSRSRDPALPPSLLRSHAWSKTPLRHASNCVEYPLPTSSSSVRWLETGRTPLSIDPSKR